MAPDPTVLLVHPTGRKGGGMMRAADYLRGAASGGRWRIRYEVMDVRGDGPLATTPWVFARQRLRLASMIRRDELQLIHLFVGDRLSLLRKCAIAQLAKRAGVPVLLHLHAYDLPDTIDHWPGPVSTFVRRTFAGADGVAVLGPAAAEFVSRRFGVEAARLHVIANGVAAPQEQPAVYARADNRILFCGDLSERKGVGLLLEAFAHPTVAAAGATLVLAGGGDIAGYAARARALGLEGRVTFLGWQQRDAVMRLMRECRALALPSNAEALPLAVLEALGHGLPCITTPVGELPGYSAGTDAIRYVEPGRLAELIVAIATLATDDRLAARLGYGGRRLYESHFLLETFAAAMYHLQRSLIGTGQTDGYAA